MWEHSWSATLWQYRGKKEMKENSLARAEIRWAKGWRREGEKNNLKSNCVLPVGSRGLQRDTFSSTCRSAPSPAWCDHVNIQPVLLSLATSHLAAFIGKVTGKTNSQNPKQASRSTRNQQALAFEAGHLNVLVRRVCQPLNQSVSSLPFGKKMSLWCL